MSISSPSMNEGFPEVEIGTRGSRIAAHHFAGLEFFQDRKLVAAEAWLLTAHAIRLSWERMGKVLVKIKLTNYLEFQLKQRRPLKGKPRSGETEALVDTGATRLYLKTSVIRALGLEKEGEVHSKTTNGVRRRAVYQAARLDLMERHGAFEVVEADEDAPNLMGQIPLEYLDFVVDPNGRRLIPNPEHGDKQMSEEY